MSGMYGINNITDMYSITIITNSGYYTTTPYMIVRDGRKPSAGMEESMDGKRKKILIGAAVVVVALIAVAAVFGNDTYDYKAQAKENIDKFGFDADVRSADVQKGTNIFGMSIIKVTGTFSSGGSEHKYEMNTYSNHEAFSPYIDEKSYPIDKIGKSSYNYTVSELAPFEYKMSTYTYTESPDEGMRFVLVDIVVKNVAYTDGLPVRAPEVELDNGNRYTHDYSATSRYSSSYSSLSDVTVSVGNEARYCLVYQVPEDAVVAGVEWDWMYFSLYGYVLDETLVVKA